MKTATARHLCFLLFCVLSIGAFHASFRDWMRLADDQRYSLVLVIPLLTGVLVYLKRKAIFLAPQPAPGAGIALFLAGLFLYVLPRFTGAGRGYILSVTMLAVVFIWMAGFVLCYGGRAFRAALFPLLFLALMVPLPPALLDALTRGLQSGSAEWTYRLFRLIDVPVFRDGFRFSLPGVNIEVAEQCSSIRSSLALFITSILVGYVFLRPGWRRVCLSLLAFPIAIFTNGIRIVTLSSLAAYVDPGYLYGYLHHDGGALFSLISVVLLLALLFLLQAAENPGDRRVCP